MRAWSKHTASSDGYRISVLLIEFPKLLPEIFRQWMQKGITRNYCAQVWPIVWAFY